MSKHRQLVYGAQIPQDWLDAIQELISTYISPNAVATVLNATTVQVAAGTVNDEVGVSIGGAWRYNTAPVTATHPGGAAGTYNLWATSAANSFAIGPPEVDSTVYTFALQILAVGSTPGTALSRIIGSVQWNGSAVIDANLLFDDPATHGSIMPGDIIISASASRAGALLCDGTSYLRATYPALFNALGGTASVFGLPDGTHFQVPDYRGRTLIGVGTGTGLTARALGATGGAETVTLSSAESGLPAHTHPSGGVISGTTGTGSTGTGSTGTGTTGAGVTDGTRSTGTGSASGTTATEGAHTHGYTAAGTTGVGSTDGVDHAVITAVGATTGAGSAHSHTISGLVIPALTIPALSVAGMSIPALSIPALSIPALTISLTDPSTPANSTAAASSAHQNMQPWATGYYFVKT